MLGTQIKCLRTERGITQTELAVKLNISKQAVSNWENDNILPSIEMLLRLADFFGVTTDYLLERDNRRYLEITGLTDAQLAHIQQIIDDIAQKQKCYASPL